MFCLKNNNTLQNNYSCIILVREQLHPVAASSASSGCSFIRAQFHPVAVSSGVSFIRCKLPVSSGCSCHHLQPVASGGR